MDDDRLKQGKTAFGKDYFRELLERVRSIRASERRIWQQQVSSVIDSEENELLKTAFMDIIRGMIWIHRK